MAGAALIVDLPVPFLILISLDLPLDRVVSSGDRGHVPFQLLEISSLVKSTNLHEEEHRNEDS